jgi:hypothetical protein
MIDRQQKVETILLRHCEFSARSMFLMWRTTMTAKEPDARAMEDPEGHLEDALIEEFLRARGIDAGALHVLPEVDAKRLLTEASAYATSKLAEVAARAHFVHEIHSEK